MHDASTVVGFCSMMIIFLVSSCYSWIVYIRCFSWNVHEQIDMKPKINIIYSSSSANSLQFYLGHIRSVVTIAGASLTSTPAPITDSFSLPKIIIFVILDQISLYTRHSRVTANLINEKPRKSAVLVGLIMS